MAYFKDGKVRASFTAADGLGEGFVSGLRLDADRALWAATQGGLSRVKDGHVSTLTSKNGLPCDSVHWAMEDKELDAWTIDPKRTIQFTLVDALDGVRSNPYTSGANPIVTKTADGKLWFLPHDGVSVIDPRHLPFNKLPPPVHIEQVTADGQICWQTLAGTAPASSASALNPSASMMSRYAACSIVPALVSACPSTPVPTTTPRFDFTAGSPTCASSRSRRSRRFPTLRSLIHSSSG